MLSSSQPCSSHQGPTCTISHDNKKVCQLYSYFGKSPVHSETNAWKCTCGTVRKQNVKLGYTNLISHIKQKHPNYLEMFHLFQEVDCAGDDGKSESETASVITSPGTSLSGQTTLEYMLDSRSTNIFKWLEWIVMGELELIFCEKDLTRSNTKLQPISVKTLKKYMFKLVEAVEKKVSVKVSTAPSYALVFDGWRRIQRTLLAFLSSTLARSMLLILKFICWPLHLYLMKQILQLRIM